MPLTFEDIKSEFDQSLGYVRQDIAWLRKHNSGLNYTVALLIGCGCEMLAASAGDNKRRGETVLADMLPGDWHLLAKRLYTAIRDGIAHGFDTKQPEAEGKRYQIYVSWHNSEPIKIEKVTKGLGLFVGMKPLSAALIAKIDAYEKVLRNDEEARKKFKKAYDYQRIAPFNANDTAAWRRLVKDAGY